MVYLNVLNLVQFGTYLSVFRTPCSNVSLVTHLGERNWYYEFLRL